MNKVILVSSSGIATRVSGVVWQVTADNVRERVYEGEVLESGTLLELNDDSTIEINSINLIKGEQPDSTPLHENITDSSGQTSADQHPIPQTQHASNVSGITPPEIIPLAILAVSPTSGFNTSWQSQQSSGYEDFNKLSLSGDGIILPAILIHTPITADNIVNRQESKSLTVSGTVINVEPMTPIILTLADHNGHELKQETKVDDDGIHWKATLSDLPKELEDGSIKITAQTSDGSKQNVSDTTTFLLDTITPVTLALAHESDSCYGHPGYYFGNPTSDNRPLIVGTAEPGATLSLLIDDHIEVSGLKINNTGQWSVQLTEPLKDGIYQLKAESKDIAGNTSTTEFPLTIDTKAEVWINDIDSYQTDFLYSAITGETTGINNNRVVQLDFYTKSDQPTPIASYDAPVKEASWKTSPLYVPLNNTSDYFEAYVEDRACTVVRDQMVPLGNPGAISFHEASLQENKGSALTKTINPVANHSTQLSFSAADLQDLPAELKVIDDNNTFPLTWQTQEQANSQILKAIYQNKNETQTAFSITLPARGDEDATATLYKPLDHSIMGDSEAIILNIPYLKSLYSAKYNRTHHSKAGFSISIFDDSPAVIDHPPVSVIEGEVKYCGDNACQIPPNDSCKLFTPNQLGADGGELTAINDIPVNAITPATADPFTGLYPFTGQYGTLYASIDGCWNYQAKPAQIHLPDKPLTDTFNITVTDQDGDSDTAPITFYVLDGPAPVFAPASVKSMIIDQECEQPAPSPDYGSLEVIKGSDPLLPAKLQFNLNATTAALQQSLGDDFPNSGGAALDLTNLHPGPNNQSLTLSTVYGDPVLDISLQNIHADALGNLQASLKILQIANLNVVSSSPAVLPMVISATDQDISSATHTIDLTMVDGTVTLYDDNIQVVEGKTVTGNLLTNDQHCLDTLTVTAVEPTPRSLIENPPDNNKFTYLPNHTIKTLYGDFVVQANGDYQFTAKKSLKNRDPIKLNFDYTATDSSGDTASAKAIVSIIDGTPASGGDQLYLTMKEESMSRSPGYPVYKSSQPVALSSDGSDAIDPMTLTFTADPDMLNGVLTSLGNPVTFTINKNHINGFINDHNGVKPVLKLTLEKVGKGVDHQIVRVLGELDQPLDHIHGISGSNLINISDQQIVLKLPFTYQDIDGTLAKQESLLTTTIIDGAPPALIQSSRLHMEEDNLPATATGTISAIPNADPINPASWQFTSDQPGLNGLFSNDLPLEIANNGQTITLYTAGQLDNPVLTMTLDDAPLASTPSTLHYTATLTQGMNQDKGQWPLIINVAVSDSDGDTTKAQLEVEITDHSQLNLSLDIHELVLKEPIYLSDGISERVPLQVSADSDIINDVFFLKPDSNVTGFVIDDTGNRITSDGLPIKFFPAGSNSHPNERWEAWSMDGENRSTHILDLSTVQPDGSSIIVPAGETINTSVGVTWLNYIDHLTPSGEHTASRSMPLTLQARDADGSTVNDTFELWLLDGALPVTQSIHQPPATTDINKGNSTLVEGSFEFQPGSDRPVLRFDLPAIQKEFLEYSSDGKALVDFTSSGKDNSVLTISREDDHFPVFRFSVSYPASTTANVQFEQLDNLDHPITSGNHSESITFDVPVILSDSDKSVNSNPMTFKYTVMDTVPEAHGDFFGQDGKPIAIEGKTVGFTQHRNLLTNDDLHADIDGASVSGIVYNGVIHTIGKSGKVDFNTDAGRLIVLSNGQWRLITKPHIDHAQGENFTLKMTSIIQDGDGDVSTAPFQITIRDQPARFEKIVNARGEEDTTTPIPVQFSINLGDIDRHETINTLSVKTVDLQGGKLLWHDQVLPATKGTIYIPLDALHQSSVNENAIFTARDLGYLPAENASDFTLKNHQITLRLHANIHTDPGPDQGINSKLVIHIDGIADAPIWPDQLPVITGLEDRTFPLQPKNSSIKAELQDTDTSEKLTYEITQLSPDLSLSLPNGNPVTAGEKLSPEQFSSLSITPREHWAGSTELHVNATATEKGNFATKTASTPQVLIVNVVPVADKLILTVYPAGPQSDLAVINGYEDQKIDIGDHIKASLTDADDSESLFLRITPLIKAGESMGSLWVNNNGTWNEIRPGKGFFEVSGDAIPHLFYQPAEDRSSANFSTLKLQINAISRESSQDEIEPAFGAGEAISDNGYLQIDIAGVPDHPEIISNEIWQLNDTKQDFIIGHGFEDSALPLKFALISGDIDDSENLNSVISLPNKQFRLLDDHGNPPPIARVVKGEPMYQISPEDLKQGIYSIKPPHDFAGTVLLPMDVLVTELDGASQTFTYQLEGIFQPVIDTPNQISDTLKGVEVSINRQGGYQSGGAPFSLQGIHLKDDDGSESITDINHINLPQGFGVMIDGRLRSNAEGSFAKLLGSEQALENALQHEKIVIVPVNPDGTINHDYPTPDNHTTHFSYDLTIRDAQNGLVSSKVIKVSSTIDWKGEVDGQQPEPSPFNPNENTQVAIIGNPPPMTGNDFPLNNLKLISTDSDGSEALMTSKVPQYEINVFDQHSGDKVTSGWNLATSGSQQLIFDNEAWLVQSGGLKGVSVHFTELGDYSIQIKGIVKDIGDQEARYARWAVTVDHINTHASEEPTPPDNIVHCSEPTEGQEDHWLTIPEACIDLSLAHTTEDEQTTFQIHVIDLNNWTLAGSTSNYWGDNGQIISYLINPEDFSSLKFRPPGDFSGLSTIQYQTLKQHTLSDKVSSTTFDLYFDIAPIADPPSVSTTPDAIAPEWSSNSQPSPLNLHIQPGDKDRSETLEGVVFTPPEQIHISGSGLTNNTAVRQAGESEAAFEQRISSFTFTPESGAKPGVYTLPFTVEVLDTAPGTGKTDRQSFPEKINLTVTPINHCTNIATMNQAGQEDNTVTISGLSARLNDADGSETLSVTLSGVPAGAVLSEQSGKLLPFNGRGEWQVPSELISANGVIEPLSLQPPKDFSGIINLTLNTYSHEKSITTICTDQATFSVNIQPVADHITANSLEKEYTGQENTPLSFDLNARTTDTNSDSKDLVEGLKMTFTISGDSNTLFPKESAAIQPTLQIPGSPVMSFVAADSGYFASMETSSAVINQVNFNAGDGYGTANISITLQSVDKTTGMTTSYGPEVIRESTVHILPKSDLPILDVTGNHIFATPNTAIPLNINASVINPAMVVSTPVGTELYVEISGIPEHASLVDSQLKPVGLVLSTGSVALTSTELNDLYLIDSQVSSYNLSVHAVSDVGDGDRQTSSAIPVNVTISADHQNLMGVSGDNILIANGSVPVITGGSGNDVIATGAGKTIIYPGSGNNQIWAGSYGSTEHNHQDTFAFQTGNSGRTNIHNYDPGVDHIDLSKLLKLNGIWDSTTLAEQVVISDVEDSTQITVESENILLDAVPMDVLLPNSSGMTSAQYLNTLVSSGNLVVSNQYGHDGTDILHVPTASELIGDGVVYGGGGNDTIYANSEGSKIQAGPGNNQLILDGEAHAKDTLYWVNSDAGTAESPYQNKVIGFQPNEDVIDIASYLPKDAVADPYHYMNLTYENNNTYLNIANSEPDQWTDTIELTGVDWLQGGTSEDALRQQIEQNALVTGFHL
ncbi:Ig-like domain-containing protein [Endozoicomonas ascidiicola]|uniref:Ig-like domain-containing protein n=1 Tax=Endozoicomonas ascidiicola TaxID=1698521 RepID=UPI00082CDA27|nr:Ig-like domain-containing protein [Endozoicomonas ascidiicola]